MLIVNSLSRFLISDEKPEAANVLFFYPPVHTNDHVIWRNVVRHHLIIIRRVVIVVNNLRTSIIKQLKLRQTNSAENARHNLSEFLALDYIEGLCVFYIGVLRVYES